MTRGLIAKLIWVGLVLITTLGIIYAQEDEITPLDSWIYQAMEYLYQNKIIADYPSNWVKSGKQLSRFEIAYYLKEFIIHKTEKELPVQAVEALQKLISEFRTELTDLGVKVTDIDKISPNLVATEAESNVYQDLDTIIAKNKNEKLGPYYYYGQYFNELQRKSFIFIPSDYIEYNYDILLDENISNINIVYGSKIANNPSFLVVKGSLPVDSKQSLIGYYLFPIEENKNNLIYSAKYLNNNIDNSVLTLLDEINQIQQVDNLWRFNGVVPLDGYSRLDTDFQASPFVNDFDAGLKIGSFLICTENPSDKNKFEVNNFGLPFYNPRQIAPSAAVDLDAINGKNLQSLQINILGSVALSPQTSLYGGFDFLFRGTNTGLNSIWPSDTKASAGLNYHFNDYFTVLTYQSFVNSQLKTGLLSTTSVGVDYNDWATLWLAYQLVNFDNPVVSGSVSFRF